jgi:hypothetical protein
MVAVMTVLISNLLFPRSKTIFFSEDKSGSGTAFV